MFSLTALPRVVAPTLCLSSQWFSSVFLPIVSPQPSLQTAPDSVNSLLGLLQVMVGHQRQKAPPVYPDPQP